MRGNDKKNISFSFNKIESILSNRKSFKVINYQNLCFFKEILNLNLSV